MKVWVKTQVVAAVIAVVAFTGCAKQQVVTEPAADAIPEARLTEWREVQPGDPEAALLEQALASGAMHTVYFGYDKFNLRPEAVEKMKLTAAWLIANPTVVIRVEGHCDDRGTDAYNLALGQRRASSALKYLLKAGVDEDRISVISYGEERPAVLGQNEAAWAKNRRSEFKMLVKAP